MSVWVWHPLLSSPMMSQSPWVDEILLEIYDNRGFLGGRSVFRWIRGSEKASPCICRFSAIFRSEQSLCHGDTFGTSSFDIVNTTIWYSIYGSLWWAYIKQSRKTSYWCVLLRKVRYIVVIDKWFSKPKWLDVSVIKYLRWNHYLIIPGH